MIKVNKDILICGVGGQGTVLASGIIAASAAAQGYAIHSAETIGMAQRGGSVTSHVRIGRAHSPLIPFGNADILLAFEPAEAVRNLRYLKEDGVVIVNTTATKPVTASLKDSDYDGREMTDYIRKKCACIFVDSEKVTKEFGSSRFFNIIMLGIAAGSGKLELDKGTLQQQIEKRVPAAYVDINKQAFQRGYEIGSKAAAGQNL